MVKNLFIITLLYLYGICAFAQNVMNDVDSSTESANISTSSTNDIVTEKIHRISNSKRIFVITNSNNYIARGDYVTFLLNGKAVARGLTAKTDESFGAIKMLKIYSLTRWNRLQENLEIQIIKGDDSFLRNKKADPSEKQQSKITNEDDLYNDTMLESDSVSNESNKKVIKNDNLLTFGYATVNGVDNNGDVASYGLLSGAWAYQLHENVFAELGLGQTIINDFPSPGLDSKLMNLVAKIKYTFNTPLFTVTMPYVGYQSLTASYSADGSAEPATLAEEEELIGKLEKSGIVFGVTVLRKLVPGWYIRGDLGTDQIAAGLTLEF
jgi:hypothetical protein